MQELKPPQYPNNIAAMYLLHVIEDRHAAKRAIEQAKRYRAEGFKDLSFWIEQAWRYKASSWRYMRKYQALVHKDIYYEGWGDNLVEVPLPQPEDLAPDAA